jgi:hypothetical protein
MPFTKLINAPINEAYYLDNQPVGCRIVLQTSLFIRHTLGIESAAYLERMMHACHLHNAGMQEGLLDPQHPWSDLAYVIEAQTVAKISVGGLPRSFEDCRKRLELVTGYKPSQDARAFRRRQTADMKDGPGFRRSTRQISVFSTLVRQTYPDKGISGWTWRSKSEGTDDNEPIYLGACSQASLESLDDELRVDRRNTSQAIELQPHATTNAIHLPRCPKGRRVYPQI